MKKIALPLLFLFFALMVGCTSPDEAARFFAYADSVTAIQNGQSSQSEVTASDSVKTGDTKASKAKKTAKSTKTTPSTKSAKTTQTAESVQEVKPNRERPFVLTGKGVGAVKMDMLLKKLPKAVDGLYDSYSVRDNLSEGHFIVTFTLGGEAVMEAQAEYPHGCVGDNEMLTIRRIIVKSDSAVGVKIKGQVYGVGDNIKPLIDKKAVRRVNATQYKSGDVIIKVANSGSTSVIQSLAIETKVNEDWF